MNDEQIKTEKGLSQSKSCSACGFAAARKGAKFCQVCGQKLSADYQPLDRLRASYHLKTFAENQVLNQSQTESTALFGENRNRASSTAVVFVVYSLVPYLGILFCPGALVFGGVGLATSYQKPCFGGRDTAIYSLLFGAVIFAVQILLWWLLYSKVSGKQ